MTTMPDPSRRLVTPDDNMALMRSADILQENLRLFLRASMDRANPPYGVPPDPRTIQVAATVLLHTMESFQQHYLLPWIPPNTPPLTPPKR